MSHEIRYYPCPHCKRRPHLRFTEDMKAKIIEMECEFCLHTFDVDERNTRQVNPEIDIINKGLGES